MRKSIPINQLPAIIIPLQRNSISHIVHQNTTNPSNDKYFISMCQQHVTDDDPTTKDWLTVSKTLKLTNEYDKSRVLLGVLQDRDVVVKIGDDYNIKNEFEIGRVLRIKQVKGFIKFICFFECNDNFTKYHGKQRGMPLCNGKGSSMKIIVMPNYPMKSMGSYDWVSWQLNTFKSCCKQVMFISFVNFHLHGFIHGDLHLNNVLLKKKKANMEYVVENERFVVKRYGVGVVLMDFENARFGNPKSANDVQDFYYDIHKFFMFIHTILQKSEININRVSLNEVIRSTSVRNDFEFNQIKNIMTAIDLINFAE